MAPGYGNYNSICGNQWLSMLGLNSMSGMGIGSFGSLTNCGNSIFTNCYGEVNYNAMAGYGVANALVGVAGQAWAAHQANKEPEINYTQEIKTLIQDINTKTDKRAELAAEIKTEGDKITAAGAQIKALENQIKELGVEDKKKAWEDAAKTTPQPDNVGALKDVYDSAVRDMDNLNKRIKEQQDIIDTATTKIGQNETACAKLDEEIKRLNKRLEAYQEKVNEKILDNADRGKLQRAGKSCLDKLYNETNPASERELSRAFYEFNKAENDIDKKIYAKKIVEMYDSNSKLEKANGSNKQGYEIVKKWLESHQ